MELEAKVEGDPKIACINADHQCVSKCEQFKEAPAVGAWR